MTLFLFILILSILVFVHELGHFLMAKRAGIIVEEFGFGLPPRIFGKKIGETIYSLNALPIGGFVKLYGEDGSESETKEVSLSADSENKGRAYFEKSILSRLLVLVAGVTMNLLLAIVAFSVLYFVYGIPTKTGKIVIVGISKNSPAELSELKLDDQIISIDGQKLNKMDDFISITKTKAGNPIKIEVERAKDNPCKIDPASNVLGGMAGPGTAFNCNGENLIVSLIPRVNPPEDEGPLGVAITDTEMKKYPWYKMPFLGVAEGFKESVSWGKMILSSLWQTLKVLITQGKIPKDVAGPIGIFQVTGEVAKGGFLAVLQFMGILSVNLAIINILPLPALDGGRLIFLVYEGIFRKKANPKVEALVNNIGMAFLLSLMILITINDVIRLVKK